MIALFWIHGLEIKNADDCFGTNMPFCSSSPHFYHIVQIGLAPVGFSFQPSGFLMFTIFQPPPPLLPFDCPYPLLWFSHFLSPFLLLPTSSHPSIPPVLLVPLPWAMWTVGWLCVWHVCLKGRTHVNAHARPVSIVREMLSCEAPGPNGLCVGWRQDLHCPAD